MYPLRKRHFGRAVLHKITKYKVNGGFLVYGEALFVFGQNQNIDKIYPVMIDKTQNLVYNNFVCY